MIELLNIDCMEYMAGLPDKAFSLAIVDPPYGSNILVKNKYQRNKNTGTYKNDSIPPAEYYKQLVRVSMRQIIWGCQYQMQYLWHNGSFIVWDKRADPDLHNMSACDVAWLQPTREKIRKFTGHWCGAVKCEPEDTIHIHQKPVKLYQWLLKHYAKPHDRILDTHLGSGSSAIAAHRAKLNFVGCEIDKDYYEAACKRFKEQTAQQQLFQ